MPISRWHDCLCRNPKELNKKKKRKSELVPKFSKGHGKQDKLNIKQLILYTQVMNMHILKLKIRNHSQRLKVKMKCI